MLIFLVGITLIALLLRVVFLGEVPVGFHRDEAFLGYNAYSILLTGKDMTGHVLPLHLASFLFSPSGYSYFSIPFIALFGLSEFSVRLASALFGTATVVATYFLVKELLTIRMNKESAPLPYVRILPLVSTFFLAISPWHINLSRTATENVIVVCLITLGVLSYLQWIKREKVLFLFISFLLFGVSLVVYQAPRSFLPLFLPLLFFVFPPRSFSFLHSIRGMLNRSLLGFWSLFVLIIVFPILFFITSPELSERFRMLSIFHTPETQLVLDEQLREDGVAKVPPVVARLFHNKVINYSQTFLSTYFSHFTYEFLFTDAGFPDRYRVAGMGLLYLWDLPLFIIGTTILLKRRRRLGIFLLGWVFFAPVGSGLTYDDVPNLQRTLLVFPALSLISAVGLVTLWKTLKQMRFSGILKIIILFIVLYSICYYVHQYYVHQVHHRPWHRQEGYKELVTRVNQLLPNYSDVIISDHETEPIIFFLFYSQYDPDKIQERLADYQGGKFPSFEKYVFTHDQCPLRVGGGKASGSAPLIGKKGILYVNHGTCKIKDRRIETIAEITRTDGTHVFWIQKIK